MPLADVGAEHIRGPFDATAIDALLASLPQASRDRPGERIANAPELDAWLRASGLTQLVSTAMARPAKAVRAILFDKAQDLNWSLGWHQDRTIAVKERCSIDGYGPWSVKAGIAHVEPPFELIEKMLTARIHIDRVDGDNGPLLVAEGSHRLGKITEPDIEALVSQCRVTECHADAGDVWLYASAILHASGPNCSTRRRRVLHVDFSADALPPPMEWKGIV